MFLQSTLLLLTFNCFDKSAEQSENDLLRTRSCKTLAKLKLRLNNLPLSF